MQASGPGRRLPPKEPGLQRKQLPAGLLTIVRPELV